MMSGNWEFYATDEAIAEDLRGFIPPRVFDVHAHLYRVADLALEPESFLGRGPAEVTVEQWQKRVGRQMPGADLSGGLFIPDPLAARGSLKTYYGLRGPRKWLGTPAVSPETTLGPHQARRDVWQATRSCPFT